MSLTGCMSLNGISDLVEKLKKRGAHKVALQFPEGLKRQAAGIVTGLKDAGFEVIVSGDPCYGACDLALDTLADGNADVLVHFGHAQLINGRVYYSNPGRLTSMLMSSPVLSRW